MGVKSIDEIKSGPQKYRELQLLWDKEGFQTVADFLCHYNNNDTFPLLNCLLNFRDSYKEKEIDILCDIFSLPGAARKLVFKQSPLAEASLFTNKDQTLFWRLHANLTGGSSIVWKHFAEVVVL